MTPIRSTLSSPERSVAYGEQNRPTLVDRFGVWLSLRQVMKHVCSFQSLRVGDFGCGYHARIVAGMLQHVESAVLVDIRLAEYLKRHPKVTAIEGHLPEALHLIPDASLDLVLCTSVLEHLWQPLEALREICRALAPGGMVLINVPSWRGKRFLEFSAFRLGMSPAEEMDDHKMYYDVRDLWPLLVQSGFLPHNIRCFTHKFGLNTYAVCMKR